MGEIDSSASDVAAKATGLRPDQIARAVEEYRRAADALHTEPQWRAITHMSGPQWGHATYGSSDTMVVLEIESWRAGREEKWHESRHYGFAGKAFDTYGEARTAELLALTKTTPHAVATPP